MNNDTRLRLVHFGQRYSVPDPSPFCAKAEAYLRMVGADYTTVEGSPIKAPRGQLPVLLHGKKVIAGSQEIVDYARVLHNDPVDSWLTEKQQAHAYHLAKSVEEFLYFCLLYQRWIISENFEVVKKSFFSAVPAFVRPLLAHVVRRGTKKRVMAQGIGRYTAEEIDQHGYQSLTMIATVLGEKSYFMGTEPCWVDASLYGFLGNVRLPQFTRGLGRRIGEFPTLVAFEERFRKRYFPELEGHQG